MSIEDTKRRLVWHGIFLFLLGLFGPAGVTDRLERRGAQRKGTGGRFGRRGPCGEEPCNCRREGKPARRSGGHQKQPHRGPQRREGNLALPSRGVTKDGPSVHLDDEKGNRRVSLELSKDRSSSLTSWDKEGNVAWKAP
jgi:hypothetical protein